MLMHKKSLRLFIATLSLSLTTLLGGCGHSDSSSSTEVKQEPIVQNSTTESSRFSAENVEVSGVTKDTHYEGYDFFDYSYIITDKETGQQWLYLYHDGGYDGGPVMVELDTTETPSNVEE